MRTSTRVRTHLRNNVVGYVAMFFAIGGGTAWATHPGGANTISTGDIQNEQVFTQDLANNNMTSLDIRDDTLGSGGLQAIDLRDDSVGASEIQTDGVQATEIANNTIDGGEIIDNSLGVADLATNSVGSDEVGLDALTDVDLAASSVTQSEIATDGVAALEIQDNSIDSGEIVDFSLTNQDVGVLFAQINADGTVANSSGGVTTIKIGTGTYEVDYGRNIASCAYVTTQGESGAGGAGGAITGNTDRSGNVEATFTTTRTDANALADRAFQQIVVC